METEPAGRDLALDLGSSNTLIHQQDRGVVLDKPTLVAVDSTSGQLVAAGSYAVEKLGRTPASVVTVHPLVDEVVTDTDLTKTMLSHFIHNWDLAVDPHPDDGLCAQMRDDSDERGYLLAHWSTIFFDMVRPIREKV